jgi:2-polyprenyl-3-methyl-5-hydroxy-6-metoxy-1,4-benzoquinol methylase
MSPSDRAGPSGRKARDQALFERVAADYHRKDLMPAHRRARRHRLMQTLRSVGLPPGCSVLEAGCGAGFAADYLSGRYGQYMGIDYSQELIGYARKYNALSSVRFEVSDVNEFESDERFDLILMIGLLHHLDDPEKILVKMTALLKPGGWVVANEPQTANPLFQIARKLRMSLDRNYSNEQVQYGKKQLAQMFCRAGFSEIRIVPQGLFSTPLAEVAMPLQGLMSPVSAVLCALDGAIERCVGHLVVWPFWNLIVAGRHPHGERPAQR